MIKAQFVVHQQSSLKIRFPSSSSDGSDTETRGALGINKQKRYKRARMEALCRVS